MPPMSSASDAENVMSNNVSEPTTSLSLVTHPNSALRELPLPNYILIQFCLFGEYPPKINNIGLPLSSCINGSKG